MKNYILLLLITTTFTFAQQNDWENPRVIGINKLPARATMYSYASSKDALVMDKTKSERVQSLNGTWKFNFSTAPKTSPANFLEANFNDWKNIKVPSNWEMQGFGQRIYTNSKHPWGTNDYPYLPEDNNPVGIYKRDFKLPSDWKNMNVRIHFGGVSGMHRDVMLFAEPKASISDFFVKTDLDKIYKDATLMIRPKVTLPKEADAKDFNLVATLYEGTSVVKESKISVNDVVNYWWGQRWTPKFDFISMDIQNPKKWSAETPNLYKLVLTLKNKNNKVLEAKSCNVGFRKFETKDGVFTVNGKAVKLYGVNRHDHNPKTGKTVSYQDMKRDMELLKQYNFNAVRCSHYPNNPEFYDLCDAYGIYVMDEANVESHGVRGELTNNPIWTSAYVERAIRMVERDAERILHYEGANGSGGPLSPQNKNTPVDNYDFVDIISRMYPLPDEFLEMDFSKTKAKPVISCEYSHAMGNSNGGLKEIWDIIHSNPQQAGGFIWDWMDQGITVKEENGCEQFVYGGYFGSKLTDGNFCINGVINADQTVKPVMYECKYVFQPLVFSKFDSKGNSFVLKNRHRALNTDRYNFAFELLEDGLPVEDGKLNVQNIAAGEKAVVKINSTYQKKAGKEYFYTVKASLKKATIWAEANHVVASEQFKVAQQSNVVAAATKSSTGSLEGKENGGKLVISNDKLNLTFDTKTGVIILYRYDGKELLKKPIQPNFWRAITDNDKAVLKGIPDIEVWKKASENQKLISFDYNSVQKSTFEVTVGYQLGEIAHCKMKYSIDADGSIAIDYLLNAPTYLPNIPRVGVQFGIPNDLDQISWYGRGPHENYVDRNISAFVGTHTRSLANFAKPYVFPQEYANRTDTRWAQFIDASGKGMQIKGGLFEFSAYPYTIANLEQAKYICDLEKQDVITVTVDHKQQGVAGYNSWSMKAAPLVQHSIPAQSYTYKIVIKPIGF